MRNFCFLIAVAVLLCSSACQNANNGGGEAAAVTQGDYEMTAYAGMGGLQKAVKKEGDKVIEEGDMLSGKREGTWLEFHKRNGLLKSMTSYRAGIKHGPAITADDRGNITRKSYFINNKLEGESIKYNRTRLKETAFYKNGKLDGERTIYYENGQDKIQEQGTFKNGERHGITKWFDQEGAVTIEYEYDNGKKLEK